MNLEYQRQKARMERDLIEVEGRMINPNVPHHGTVNGYSNYRCRCWECSDAWADECYERRQRRRAKRRNVNGRLVAVGAEHGKYSTALNYGCRCVHCLEALRHADAARRTPLDKHENEVS